MAIFCLNLRDKLSRISHFFYEGVFCGAAALAQRDRRLKKIIKNRQVKTVQLMI